MREAQRLAVIEDKHAALTVIWISDATNLHPTNKRELGRRLAIAARHLIYGERLPPSGPAVAGVSRRGPDIVVVRHRRAVDPGREFERLRVVRRDPGLMPLGRSPRAGQFGGAAECRKRYASALCLGRIAGVSLHDSGLPAGPFEVGVR